MPPSLMVEFQVTSLLGASVDAKRRLEACREKNMSLMHRFLVLLQRIQVRTPPLHYRSPAAQESLL